MRIGIIGVRGIPVIYSGFETFAQELAVRMADQSYEMVVYGRKAYVDSEKKTFQGVSLVTLPSPRSKNFETVVHSFLSMMHAILVGKFDALYFLGVGSALFCGLPRLFGVKTIINVDGLDWRREKWGKVASWYLSMSEKLAIKLANVVITDSQFIRSYYLDRYNFDPLVIPYGYYMPRLKNGKKKARVLKKYGLKKDNYLVWVGRLVPDNHLDELLEAFKKSETKMKCVIVGDDLTSSGYKNKMRKLAISDNRVVFTGFLERDEYEVIVSEGYAYIETKRSGGTHPSLVEAMGFGSLILCCDHPANREVLAGGGVFYPYQRRDGMKLGLKKLFEIGDSKKKYKSKAIKRAESVYSWNGVVSSYKELFSEFSGG